MQPTFEEFLTSRRRTIETHLEASLVAQEGLPDELLDAMRYSLLAPGKRLRPLLVLLAWEACGMGPLDGDTAYPAEVNPWPAACAVEMVHVYSLIHDDLPAMDDDDLRRGLPTCHRKFSEATAILAGDALLTYAFQVLAESYAPATASACCADLARAVGCAGMVGGQMDDLAWERSPEAVQRTLADLEFLHARKTGALIRSCLRLGARVARGLEPDGCVRLEELERLDEYGRCLGLAFQITDDLLDVEGAAKDVGKKVGKDAARGKLTYPGLLGTEESRRRASHLGEQATAALSAFSPAARRLEELVSFVLTRDR
ncbi:MAG: farnesyl diphosphate synthase [Gemmataceae bacterium]